MPNTLHPVESPADVRLNVETFNSEAAHFYDRAERLLRETTYWVYDPVSESFGPSKFVGFTEMSFDRYVGAVAGDSEGARFDGNVSRTAIESAIGESYRQDQTLRDRLEAWGVDRFGTDAFGGSDRGKWHFVSLPNVVEEVAPRLRLTLHERYTRPDVYGLFGIKYDTRHTRHLNTGLSPALPDGGYFIFITLDKGTIAYDYEDELFSDQLIWVTRRDRDENDPAYVALRQPGIRVSLFARRADKEPFAYLGEVRWTDHEQFSNERRLQQRYVLKLRVPVPDGLLAELNGGAAQRSYTPTQTRPTTAPANLPAISRPRTRRPATLDEYHRAFRYALGTLEREVVPAHQHYQMRLRAHFEAKGVPAEWERDFIDVRWEHGGVTWIGEVKLTRYLSAAEAFRTALGQLLVYGLPTSPSRLGW